MKPVVARGLAIGEGIPKTVVPLVSRDIDENLRLARNAIAAGAQCLEWRADLCHADEKPETIIGNAACAAARLRSDFPAIPLVFTYRTTRQGGRGALAQPDYEGLLINAIDSALFDIVDIEDQLGSQAVPRLTRRAREAGVVSIVSRHVLGAAPSRDEMVDALRSALEADADIAKLAIEASGIDDALSLISATRETSRRHPGRPLVGIAMGEAGTLTRFAAEAFGSALTFCSYGQASAPGQIPLETMAPLLGAVHRALSSSRCNRC